MRCTSRPAGGTCSIETRASLPIFVPAMQRVRGDLQRHLARAVAVLNSVYAEAMRRRGYLLFHGAAVARAGRAVLILGPSRVGKSSTVLRLLDHRLPMNTT